MPWKPLDALSLRGDYTYTVAQDDILHQELLRRPRNKASLAATWQATAAATVTATVLYVGPWIDSNRAGTVTGIATPGYTIVDVAGDLSTSIMASAPSCASTICSTGTTRIRWASCAQASASSPASASRSTREPSSEAGV